MKNILECPYCENITEIYEGDGEIYETKTIHETKCTHCGEIIYFETELEFIFIPQKTINYENYNKL